MKPGRAMFLALVATVYGFLTLPIGIVVIASFNAGKYLKFPPDGRQITWSDERIIEKRGGFKSIAPLALELPGIPI